jgi:hypothetical protein
MYASLPRRVTRARRSGSVGIGFGDVAGVVGETGEVVRTADAAFPVAGVLTVPQPVARRVVTTISRIHTGGFIICIGNVPPGD